MSWWKRERHIQGPVPQPLPDDWMEQRKAEAIVRGESMLRHPWVAKITSQARQVDGTVTVEASAFSGWAGGEYVGCSPNWTDNSVVRMQTANGVNVGDMLELSWGDALHTDAIVGTVDAWAPKIGQWVQVQAHGAGWTADLFLPSNKRLQLEPPTPPTPIGCRLRHP